MTRQHLYVTECFGTVAAVVSQAGESQVDFTNSATAKKTRFVICKRT